MTRRRTIAGTMRRFFCAAFDVAVFNIGFHCEEERICYAFEYFLASAWTASPERIWRGKQHQQ